MVLIWEARQIAPVTGTLSGARLSNGHPQRMRKGQVVRAAQSPTTLISRAADLRRKDAGNLLSGRSDGGGPTRRFLPSALGPGERRPEETAAAGGPDKR